MTTLFAVWLAFVQLLGPWLCCCPAAPAPAANGAGRPAPVPSEVCRLCCKPPPGRPAKPAPAPERKPCPCLGMCAIAEAGVLRTPSAVDELVADGTGADWPHAVAFDATVGRLDAPITVAARPPNAASLPVGTRLWVHHALRL